MSGQRTIERPKVRKRSGPSIVWLIPVVTLIVGGWLIVKTISERGPEATISFRTAEGIEAGKTMVKYKDVDIGMVEAIRFSEDFSNVVLTVRFNHGTDHFLRRNTRFWVVRPQLSLRGARGLGTLLSGSHIEIDPGPGAPQRHFVGLEQQPLITADEAGLQIMLVSDNLGSIDAGSPIYYRGILAGEVLGHELGSDRRTIYIPAFIRAPYDQLIRGNTRFWNVSGMEVSMGADGPSLKMESVLALLYGGIAFDTPPSLGQPDDSPEDLVFPLHSGRESIESLAFTRKLNFVMYFDSSVRGLSVGAPVEFKGIRIGTVLDVRLEVNPEDASFLIPVLVEVEPERIHRPVGQCGGPGAGAAEPRGARPARTAADRQPADRPAVRRAQHVSGFGEWCCAPTAACHIPELPTSHGWLRERSWRRWRTVRRPAG
jgi:paraquat-inducible protein B